MPELTPPTATVQESFLLAMKEFQAEGRGRDESSMLCREIRRYGPAWDTPEGFARYVRDLRADALEETPRPEGRVPATSLWWVDGPEYLGRLAIRHRLTPWLLDVGGHIGYDVRPSARRRGHASAMLRASLPTVHALGIDPVLVTCDHDNVGSRKTIENCGGVLEDRRGEKLRFWVPTG
ncbi:GNAT family N-acetyltransferase [Actinomadura hibisca]|uniref:GNAT family N-acetyltransferase n=1 Tax=Actinomadura hibisca TaxID=68565 RepID=UPI00082D5B7A|nr:GNAT family N-acetyltransferase [Actinomadura hibisca]